MTNTYQDVVSKLSNQFAVKVTNYILSSRSAPSSFMRDVIQETPVETSRCKSNWRVRLPTEEGVFNDNEYNNTPYGESHPIYLKLKRDLKPLLINGKQVLYTFYNRTTYLPFLEYGNHSSQNSLFYTRACRKYKVQQNGLFHKIHSEGYRLSNPEDRPSGYGASDRYGDERNLNPSGRQRYNRGSLDVYNEKTDKWEVVYRRTKNEKEYQRVKNMLESSGVTYMERGHAAIETATHKVVFGNNQYGRRIYYYERKKIL